MPDGVLAGAFDRVHEEIGLAHQRVRIHEIALFASDGANAEREPPSVSVACVPKRPAKVGHRDLGAAEIGPGQEDRELIAPDAADEVRRPESPVERVGNPCQNEVAPA